MKFVNFIAVKMCCFAINAQAGSTNQPWTLFGFLIPIWSMSDRYGEDNSQCDLLKKTQLQDYKRAGIWRLNQAQQDIEQKHAAVSIQICSYALVMSSIDSGEDRAKKEVVNRQQKKSSIGCRRSRQ